MRIKEHVNSNLAIPPGEYLAAIIAEFGMTKKELAGRMNRPAPKLSAIFTGAKAITPETALQLEKVVGVPAHIWTGLEVEYRLTLVRNREVQELQRLHEQSQLVSKYCYPDLARAGFVSRKTKASDKVLELQHFFGVTDLRNIPELNRYQAAFRQGSGKRSPEATAAWLRIGELQAQKTQVTAFNKQKLHKTLTDIRGLTRLNPEKFISKLRQSLSNSGIVLVLCPHLPRTYLQGAIFWLGQSKAVLMLSMRGRWADIFWFSLFHELGHLLLHSKKMIILEDENNIEKSQPEIEADNFAANYWIPVSEYKKFLKAGLFYAEAINAFADKLNIHPGIVVGRLQHDGYLEAAWQNKLRSKFPADFADGFQTT